ncbi:shikimate kinase [Helicobacter cynogastricus]|uniref:shikimate kinase n=1 Tax=Helicobacter cynogastricus TaxID=329937 RepID=UPI001F42157D|nr:shikimate kinase [Helicobacter cynogastricus]
MGYLSKIWLIGFMGSGKSTLGALLAQALNYRFLDTDLQISAQTRTSIAQIFKDHSEAHFRELERQLVATLEQVQTPLVIATGGGLPIYTPLKTGIVIYLYLDFEVIVARLQADSNSRPLFQDRTSLYDLYKNRAPLYARIAHHTIRAHKEPSQVLQTLLEVLG